MPGSSYTATARKIYSSPQKVGNRIKDNYCWDSPYITLKDYWVSNFWASTISIPKKLTAADLKGNRSDRTGRAGADSKQSSDKAACR